MKLVIVNSGVGNVRSVANMLKRLCVEAEISDDPRALAAADALVLPGVGSFDAAMRRLRASGLKSVLDDLAAAGRTPMLGICLGMQLMGEGSEEGQEPGFGWIGGEFKRFQTSDGGGELIRIPHMGWNVVTVQNDDDPLYAGFTHPPRFYFDHSYYFVPRDAKVAAVMARHGVDFPAGVRQGLLFGVQFHPEKSHRFGFRLLSNFASFAAKHAVDAVA
ncbi:MAG: imidazole glycerol phosphate synthase subunit HisH [Hyphomicrobium sp.]|nr:imidazole glycerol phosphate synthase subunit HisH [Hyphomicrobium sp.]